MKPLTYTELATCTSTGIPRAVVLLHAGEEKILADAIEAMPPAEVLMLGAMLGKQQTKYAGGRPGTLGGLAACLDIRAAVRKSPRPTTREVLTEPSHEESETAAAVPRQSG